MDKMKIVKVDPLEVPSTLVWYMAGLLQAPLKDFVVYVDEKENILYVNKTKKIPKKDICLFYTLLHMTGKDMHKHLMCVLNARSQ